MPRPKDLPCYRCKGTGRVKVYEADPLTKEGLRAISVLWEPFCYRRDCPLPDGEPEWKRFESISVHQPETVVRGQNAFRSFNLRMCRGCGRLRRTKDSVSLRKCYRAGLRMIGGDDE